MAQAQVRIDSILGGETPMQYLAGADQYLKTIGIDPDLPISDSVGDRKTSGVLRPSAYAKFSGANVTGNPYWLLTTPKLTLLYAILNNGRLVSYDTSFASETLVGTATTSSGNGGEYYNNYIYIGANTNISRYGPLDGSPALTNSVWTGATLGSQTALVNTTYPSIRGSGTMPNHVMHTHVDGKMYVCDYDSTSSTAANRGKGLIHFVKTTYTSAEGDTNSASTYNALDLPFGFMPTCLESLGDNLVIGGIQTTNGTFSQGKAVLFFWDTFSASFFNPVALPDSIVTSLKNVNGTLYVATGSITTGTDVANGYRISRYLGGQGVQTVFFSNTGSAPLAGAMDAVGDKLIWGTFDQVQTTTAASPTYYPVVKGMGSKDPRIGEGVHTIVRATGTGTAADGIVTAVRYIEQASFSSPKFIVGWRDATTQGIDSSSTTYGTSVYHSKVFNIGSRFKIDQIRFNFSKAIAANMTITPKIFLDDFSSSSTSGLTVINNTNYASSQRTVKMTPGITGDHNFVLELTWSGTALLPILLPITITFTTFDD